MGSAINLMRKFEFDNSFDVVPAPRVVEIVPADPEPEQEPPPPPPPPTFSLEEMAAAREMAHAAGREAGLREAEAGIERRLADLAGRLCAAIEASRADQGAIVAAAHRQAAETMLRLTERMFPSLIARSGTAEIETMIDQALREGFGQPGLTVLCAEDLRERVEELVRAAAGRAGFAGAIMIRSEAGFACDDCRIEWTSGGIERATTAAIAAVGQEIRSALNDNAAVPDSVSPMDNLQEFAT